MHTPFTSRTLLDMFRLHTPPCFVSSLFFFTDPPPTETSTLSLHDAFRSASGGLRDEDGGAVHARHLRRWRRPHTDRKSTRLNSSHQIISYAVFCLKKKNKSRVPRPT